MLNKAEEVQRAVDYGDSLIFVIVFLMNFV
jgi:hypothetical protein